MPWRRKWQPTPGFLLGKSHGQRSLADYSPGELQRVRHDWATEHAQITYMWNLKYDTKEPLYETETESGTRENRLGCQRSGVWERAALGAWGWQMQTGNTEWMTTRPYCRAQGTTSSILWQVIVKKNVYTCINESFAVQQKWTHYKSIIFH